MDVIEFLGKTQKKNIKNSIQGRIQEKFKDYERDLFSRQIRLRDLLEFEYMCYNEEILHRINERIKESFQKRFEWLNTQRLERERAEEELLKLKRQQRELENCEKWRHHQTKQLLLETKESQLYQIEEKKMRKKREQFIENMWLEVMERLRKEREYQDFYESKLRHVIMGLNQQKNQKISQDLKETNFIESNKLKQESREKNLKYSQMEEKKRSDEKLVEIMKKTQQTKELQQQILDNSQRELCLRQNELSEDFKQIFTDNQKLLNDLQEREREKIRNNEWHKCYLEHCLNEKKDKRREEAEFNEVYRGTGCVLLANKKKPYNKAVR
uniref:Trichohyalin-plectin-homology domain-containing protein n=1 Tax=Glossina brevipalpis TaxID=37001 RepID=A0A1A9WJ05_9MUSC